MQESNEKIEKDRADKFRRDYNQAAQETSENLRNEQDVQDSRLDDLEQGED